MSMIDSPPLPSAGCVAFVWCVRNECRELLCGVSTPDGTCALSPTRSALGLLHGGGTVPP